ncbi:hypothetical protein SAMN04487980_102748 [Streptomyces sp. cf124]|uniref:hypothetical protein n=1 Tax=Streptomyces sp. cf124 TaxID=1761903 RepID=UPI0008F2D9D6|nr:hypothetical protein [Streptomyces sp. cf124]SFN65653.1 hypothetical protein SAMN04487980_102748 [Streptomyces sp. cf124]
MKLGIESAVAAAAEARLRSLLSRPLLDLDENECAGQESEKAAALAEVSDHLVVRASVLEVLGRYRDRFDPSRSVESMRLGQRSSARLACMK